MSTGDILIAIRPKWCAKEYTGEKRGELRKGWFEGCEGKRFLIYCSSVKSMNLTDYCEAHRATGGAIDDWSGKVIGEFICDRIDRFTAEFVDEKKYGVCYEDIRLHFEDDYDGEPNFRIVTSNDEDNPSDCDLCRDTCLSYEEIKAYIGENFHDKKFCYINFSNLVFYDKPRELSEFRKPIECHRGKQRENCQGCWDCEMKTSPKSWCYVESVIQ